MTASVRLRGPNRADAPDSFHGSRLAPVAPAPDEVEFLVRNRRSLGPLVLTALGAPRPPPLSARVRGCAAELPGGLISLVVQWMVAASLSLPRSWIARSPSASPRPDRVRFLVGHRRSLGPLVFPARGCPRSLRARVPVLGCTADPGQLSGAERSVTSKCTAAKARKDTPPH